MRKGQVDKLPNGDMKICAVYARVSTDMQGESLENQIDYAKEYVRRLGPEYVIDDAYIYQDFDQSGYYTRFVDRFAIQTALNDARQKKFKVIVFKEIARISRDQAEHIELITRFTQNGVRIIAINDNVDSDRPETLDLIGIHSVMSEMESKRISSRVSSGKKSMARRGFWVGEPPIGYRLNSETKKLEIDDEFAEIPKRIFELYTNAGYGTFKIAKYLNQNDKLTKNGQLWSRTTVGRVLKNPAYIGDLVYGKSRNILKRIFDENGYKKMRGRNEIPEEDWVVLHNNHPALISAEMFTKAQEIIHKKARQNPRRTKHPLTGILVCGRCGAGMICQKRLFKKKSGEEVEYRYYSCTSAFKYGRTMCSQPNLNADVIENEVIEFLLSRLSQLNIHDVETEPVQSDKNFDKENQKLHKELRKSQLALERLLRETDIPENTYKQLKAKYIQSIRDIGAQIAFLESQKQEEEKPFGKIRVSEYLNELRFLDKKTLDEVRLLVHELISRIVVDGNTVKEIQLLYDFFL